MMKRKRDCFETLNDVEDIVPFSQAQAQAPEDAHQDSDLLSRLPEDLLAKVLSHLTLRNAVQTSIVSHCFKNASYSQTRLKFDKFNMLSTNKDDHVELVSKRCCCEGYKQIFVGSANQFLKFHQGTNLEKFYVDFCLGVDDKEDIDQWIRIALAKDVKTLRLQFFCHDSSFLTPISQNEFKVNRYVLSGDLFGGLSKLNRLFLNGCKLDPDFSADFSSLTTLDIQYMDLAKFDLQSMLQSMPKLKNFTAVRATLPAKLSFGCLPFLKVLRLISCFKLYEIELCNAALIKLHTKFSRVIKCNLSGTSELRILGINADDNILPYMFTRLPEDQPFLESLYVYSISHWGSCIPESISKFSHLKQLSMYLLQDTPFDILKLIYVLQASPLLRTFALLTDCSEDAHRRKLELGESVHECLKEVNISGPFSTSSQIEFITYVLKSAPALKKLVVKKWVKIKDLVMGPTSWDQGQRVLIYEHIQYALESGRNIEVVLEP